MSIELAALFVSLAAIVLTIWQGMMTRYHNRLSVRPHIVARETRDWSAKGLRYRYVLSNTGLGPAIVLELSISLDGKKVESHDPAAAAVKLCFDGKARYHIATSSVPSPGYCLKPGEDYLLADVHFPEMTPEKGEQFEMPARRIQLDFESMYGERGVFPGEKKTPLPTVFSAPETTVTHPKSLH